VIVQDAMGRIARQRREALVQVVEVAVTRAHARFGCPSPTSGNELLESWRQRPTAIAAHGANTNPGRRSGRSERLGLDP
jgi:hypothetical protein